MTASSVTGVGAGAAEMTRGPGNDRGLFYSVVDPHVVWHGTVALSKNYAIVYLPSTISVPPTHLTILVAGKGFGLAKLSDDDGNLVAFLIVGYGDYVDYIIIDANNSCFCDSYGDNNN